MIYEIAGDNVYCEEQRGAVTVRQLVGPVTYTSEEPVDASTVADVTYSFDIVTGLYVEESRTERPKSPPAPSELDIIGEQLVQHELEALELRSENQMLGEQIVMLELRLLALEGGAGA